LDISGKIFIIAGAVIALASFIINYSRENQNLVLFVFAGIAMSIYGISKLPKENKQKNIHPVHKPTHQARPAANHQVKYCPRCGSALHIHYRFCPRCGASLP
jgi:hypothetical protein